MAPSCMIDIERGRIIDLLPDRTADTLAQWLTDHPGVEVISRDRGGAYAEGARTGAPDAVQVADRWHLLKNLGDALVKIFDQQRAAIEATLRSPAATPAASAPAADAGTSPAPAADADTEPTVVLPRTNAVEPSPPDRRHARYDAVCSLHAQGWSIRAIADHLGLHRATIRTYLRSPRFPERPPRSRQPSIFDPFTPYILERWNAGCHTGTMIAREVKAFGYRGSATTVLTYITRLRIAAGIPPMRRVGVTAGSITDPTHRIPSSRDLIWLVLQRPEKCDAEDQAQRDRLTTSHPDVTLGITLVREFATMVRERQHERLDSWLTRAEESGLAPLVSFTNGIRRDYAAVKTGLTVKWSNGPTEGHVNRLKQVKRQMYGRAKLDLLKLRLMA